MIGHLVRRIRALTPGTLPPGWRRTSRQTIAPRPKRRPARPPSSALPVQIVRIPRLDPRTRLMTVERAWTMSCWNHIDAADFPPHTFSLDSIDLWYEHETALHYYDGKTPRKNQP